MPDFAWPKLLTKGGKGMKCPPIPPHEKDRLAALDSYGLDGQGTVAGLTPLVEMALRVFNVPMAAVNMIGADSVFFAASAGFGDDVPGSVLLRPHHPPGRHHGRAGRHAR